MATSKLTTETRVRARPRLYYGWVIVACGMVMQALQAALMGSAYTAYVVVLQNDFGWSKTTFSLAYSLQQTEGGLLGPVQGWLVDRVGPRVVMRIGVVIAAAGFMLFSRLDSVASFYAAFLVIAIGTGLCGFLPLSSTIVHWFVRRRATAMATMWMGMGLGGLLVPIVAHSMEVNGWRATSFVSGILILCIGFPITFLMRHHPEQYGLLPDGDQPHAERGARTTEGGANVGAQTQASAMRQGHDKGAHAQPASGSHAASRAPHSALDFTVREAVRTPAFWFISLGHGSALLVVSVVQVHLIAHLKESLGFSVSDGAKVVTMITAANLCGQFIGGFLGDRISKRLIAGACMFSHALGLLILGFAANWAMVALFAILHGLGWGARGPLMQAIRADYFGRTNFGMIMGLSTSIITLFLITGPLIAGVLADALGNYRLAFIVLSAGAALGSVFWLLAKKPEPPGRPRDMATPPRVRHVQ